MCCFQDIWVIPSGITGQIYIHTYSSTGIIYKVFSWTGSAFLKLNICVT